MVWRTRVASSLSRCTTTAGAAGSAAAPSRTAVRTAAWMARTVSATRSDSGTNAALLGVLPHAQRSTARSISARACEALTRALGGWGATNPSAARARCGRAPSRIAASAVAAAVRSATAGAATSQSSSVLHRSVAVMGVSGKSSGQYGVSALGPSACDGYVDRRGTTG